MEEMQLLARKIRLLREIHDYTQEYVAGRLDISQNTYSMLEKGETKLTVDRLGKLAELYEMDIADLLKTTEQTIINKVTNNDNSSSHHQHQQVTFYSFPEEERKVYLTAIKNLESQVALLQATLEKLAGRLSA